MKKALLCLFLICVFKFGVGQKSLNQIEVNPYLRWDWYPKFTYSLNSVTTSTVKIAGSSFGLNINYKIPAKTKGYLKFGLGYYKYSFNKINLVNSLGGASGDERTIEDYKPPGNITPSIIFATNKYWYNAISLNIGIEKALPLNKTNKIVVGFNVSNYYTFSQQYHITYPNPDGEDYKLKNNRYFGFSANATIGIQKKFRKLFITPTIILPIFDIWKQDKVFPQEQNSGSRSKWLKGIGAGIIFTYTLPKK